MVSAGSDKYLGCKVQRYKPNFLVERAVVEYHNQGFLNELCARWNKICGEFRYAVLIVKCIKWGQPQSFLNVTVWDDVLINVSMHSSGVHSILSKMTIPFRLSGFSNTVMSLLFPNFFNLFRREVLIAFSGGSLRARHRANWPAVNES